MKDEVEFVIKGVEIGDLKALHRLELECFGRDAYSELVLKLLLMDSRSIALKAITGGGSIAGFVIGRLERVEGRPVGRIYTISVDPLFRKRGVAKALMRRLEDELAARGCVEAVLEVAVDNYPALKLYESLGFEFTGILRNYYGPGRHAYRARKTLSESIIRS
ncbi:MAG: GNAT family N-acetyltransferase [Nitrososphaeria archaeon]|nr:GNAT family N-acetyltransferase [Aigarchaeota archaeon]MCX8187552.1 GNAT family N-acetyltransferase [Nitrososphaeria archaeon]MDW8021513.1 GNAT family N-acetyltransferase [Nitrososphaerota archaeon]